MRNGHAIGEAGFTWTSTDESVATVGASGLVRGVGEGVATIVAAAGAIEGAAEVRVVSRDHPALTAFYEAMNGAGWIENDGWLSDRPLGEWHGVTTGPEGRGHRAPAWRERPGRPDPAGNRLSSPNSRSWVWSETG